MKLFRKATWLKTGSLILVIGFGSPVFAGPYTDTLSKRLVESTTPADRSLLMRWIFAMISLNPEFKNFTTFTPEQRTDLNKQVAKLFQDLLTVRCAKEAKDAIRYEGGIALQSSFKVLGEVAARELFLNPKVAAGAAEFTNFIDKDKIKALLQDDAVPNK